MGIKLLKALSRYRPLSEALRGKFRGSKGSRKAPEALRG